MDNTSGNVNILSGVHGTIDGTMSVEKSFLKDDIAKWGKSSNIKIFDVSDLPFDTLSKILQSGDTNICGWCLSERSLDVLKALGLIK